MKKIVLISGLVSGVILAAMTAVMMPLCLNGTIDFSHAEVFGYATMVLAFVMVFVGIRSYRENVGGGSITFGRAFLVGIAITLIASAIYVVAWEITYFGFLPDFGERYSAYLIEKMVKEGASGAAVAAKQKEMAQFRELYKNPLYNSAVTFMEVFPVGLIVTIVSAAILRKKSGAGRMPASALA